MSIQFVPSGIVEVPEISLEGEVRLPAANTALVIVDMQNDFVKPNGSLVVAAAGETVPGISQLLGAARSRGAHVAFTQDSTVEGDPEFEGWPEHCRIGTWGWEIIDELKPRTGALICRKNRYAALRKLAGSFSEPDLACRTRGDRWHGLEHLRAAYRGLGGPAVFSYRGAGYRMSALIVFDRALTLCQVTWLYRGAAVRSVKDIHFEA